MTAELFDAICDRIADGESLRTILRDDGMPCFATFYRWVEADPSHAEQYARARQTQADAIFDEMLRIADTPLIGETRKTIPGEDGKERVEITEGDMVQHRRLQIETRKWMAGKLRPKKYGDKLEVSGPGADGAHRHEVTINLNPVKPAKRGDG